MSFEFPESYRAYHSDAAVRTAVDHILDANPQRPLTLPSDINWKDLPAFHRVVLSAHQVRCEFAVSLIDLWDAVWGCTMERWEFQGRLSPANVASTEKFSNQKLHTNAVWTDGWFNRLFDMKESDGTHQIELGVCVDLERVQLSFRLWNDDTKIMIRLDLDDNWPEQDIENGIVWTRESLAPIRDDGTIDLEPVRKAAAEALTEAASACWTA